jgi:Flp pilus assembly protein TadG
VYRVKHLDRETIVEPLRNQDGEAIAEFALVFSMLILVLFAILELGLVLNAKLVLTSAAREIGRICAVEGGYKGRAPQMVDEILESTSLDKNAIEVNITPKQAIYGTTINVRLSYRYRVKSPIISAISDSSVFLRAKAVTRSEFVPR